MRVKNIFLYVVLGCVGSVLAGLGWAVSTTFPQITGEIRVADLSGDVSIVRDQDGIPFIRAETQQDAYFALGFVHAQDRFWQMEMMRRFGSGRLSEVLGEKTLAVDKWMRTLGLYRLAQKDYTTLPDETKTALDAYAQGVNAWLGGKAGFGAPELAVFPYQPYPWKPADSLVWSKIMATRLSGNFRKEVSRSRVAGQTGFDRMLEFWPDYPGQKPLTPRPGASLTFRAPLTNTAHAYGLSADLPYGASNQWVIGPDKSATRKPLLANDPHLGFAAPVLWYLADIETPDLKLSGATVPGVPFHVLGHNGNIAWGITSTQADQEDLVIERLSDAAPGTYLTPHGPEAFSFRREVIKVKNGPDQEIEVRSTSNGPVISDVRPDLVGSKTSDRVVTLSAVYLRSKDLTAHALYRLNRVAGFAEFRKALSFVSSPVLNLTYADVSGNIGLQVAGRIPLRRSGEGSLPVAGMALGTVWSGYVPYSEMPYSFNPDRGILVNANEPVGDVSRPPFISRDWAAPYRADRINQVLDLNSTYTIADMERLQRDETSLAARALLPLLIDHTRTDDKRIQDTLSILKSWNGEMDKNRAEPLVFSTWLRTLNLNLYSDDLGPMAQQLIALRPGFVRNVLTKNHHWCEDQTTKETETCAMQVTKSLQEALDFLSDNHGEDIESWRWGEAHQAWFAHSLFTHIPLLNKLTDLKIENGGSNFTVNRGTSRPRNPKAPFRHIHGPGYRAIYDLSDLKNSRYIISTGQSGNFLSRHYRNFLESWRNGAYLHLDESRISRRFELILTPG